MITILYYLLIITSTNKQEVDSKWSKTGSESETSKTSAKLVIKIFSPATLNTITYGAVLITRSQAVAKIADRTASHSTLLGVT